MSGFGSSLAPLTRGRRPRRCCGTDQRRIAALAAAWG
jgi:hypothetical protein